MIGNIVQGISNATALLKANNSSTTPLSANEVKNTETHKRDFSTVSNIARQLGESAVRAEARDQNLTRTELGAQASRVLEVFTGPEYQAAKEAYNSEVPNTQDPELLQRAVSATDYLTRKLAGDLSAKSPFPGLSHDELILIAYDEKGPYTINERRAAWGDAQKIEFSWRERTVSQAFLEYPSAQKMPTFYANVLAHYQALPAIEKAQYPEDYESRLKTRIEEESGRKVEDRQYNLFEILAGLNLQSKPGTDDKEGASKDEKTSVDKLAIKPELETASPNVIRSADGRV